MENKNQQKDAFIEFEANLWFRRNLELINSYDFKQDVTCSVIKDYGLNPSNILELGCSAGYRLAALKERYPDASVYGVEPSLEAINHGKKLFKEVNFLHTTADEIPLQDDSMDLVIVGFVLYVVDRRLLLKVMSEIDRVLKDRGCLIIVDFFTERALRNKYHHIDQFSAYTFKQEYDSLFCATGIYHLLDRSCYNHKNNQRNSHEEFQKMYTVSLLKKDLEAAYK